MKQQASPKEKKRKVSSHTVTNINPFKNLSDESSLSFTYDETNLIILPRDPEWIFVYWDINSRTKADLMQRFGVDVFKQFKFVLKVNDVTDINFDGTNANRNFYIDVYPDVKNWYVKVNGYRKRDICVQMGLIDKEKFISIARSNIITMPSGCCSDDLDYELGLRGSNLSSKDIIK